LLAKVDALDDARAQALGVRLNERDPRGAPEFMPDLEESEEELLVALMWAVGRLRPPGAFDVLERLASDPWPGLRAGACAALGSLGSPEALSAAGRCLQDPAALVVQDAARGLRRVGAPAQELLLAGLERRGTERAEVIRALGELKVAAAARPVAALLGEGGLESVEAAIALGQIGDASTAAALARQLDDPTSPARLDVIEALGLLRDPGAAEALRAELFSERPEIRAAAALAMGRMGHRDGTGVLDALRFDYYSDVRRAAEQAIGKLVDAQGAR
jgi:HEAT repeat protein